MCVCVCEIVHGCLLPLLTNSASSRVRSLAGQMCHAPIHLPWQWVRLGRPEKWHILVHFMSTPELVDGWTNTPEKYERQLG